MYDLEDLQMWEPVLFGATSKKQLILEVLKRKESQLIDKISSDQEVCMSVFVGVCLHSCLYFGLKSNTAEQGG